MRWLVGHLTAQGHRIVGAGIVFASGCELPDLAVLDIRLGYPQSNGTEPLRHAIASLINAEFGGSVTENYVAVAALARRRA